MIISSPEQKRILPLRRHSTNFIESYLGYTKEQEAPEKFHLWTAISVLAGALGRHVYFEHSNWNTYPNLFILIVGKAGIMKKSTSTGVGVELLEQVAEVKLLANQVTQAALVDALAKSRTEFDIAGLPRQYQSSLYIYASEFKNFINEIFGSLVESLTDLYDCKGHFSRQTKKEGLTKIFNPCLNMLGCSTSAWLRDAIPVKELEGGFASRILFVVENSPTGKAVPFPEPLPDGDARREKLIDDLCIINTYAGPRTLSPEARKCYSEWYKAHKFKLDNDIIDPKFAGYMGRRSVMVEKLSMILLANEGPGSVVELRHMERSIALLEELADGMYEAFENSGGNELGSKALFAYSVIRRHSGLAQNELWRLVSLEMGLHALRDVCEELAAAGAIYSKLEAGVHHYYPTYPDKTLAAVQRMPLRLRREQIHVVPPKPPRSSAAPQESGSPSQSTPSTGPQHQAQVPTEGAGKA